MKNYRGIVGLTILLIMFLAVGCWGVLPAAAAVPGTPSGLTAQTSSDSQIILHWVDKSDDEEYFSLERKKGTERWSMVESIGANVTSYVDTGLLGGTTYSYRIRAIGQSGASSYSSIASATTTGSSAEVYPPTNIKAYYKTDKDLVYITWKDISYNEEQYFIERKEDNSGWAQIGYDHGNTTSYEDSKNLYAEHTYSYRVRTFGGGKYSGYSDEVSVTIPIAIPEKPTGVKVTKISDNYNVVRWNDNSGDEFGFYIERRDNGGTYVQIAKVGSNFEAYDDYSVKAGIKYDYRIKAYNLNGESPWSNESATTSSISKGTTSTSSTSSVNSTTGVGSHLDTPSSLTATIFAKTYVKLKWVDNSKNETGFKIERKEGNGEYKEIIEVGYNRTSYNDPKLKGDTTYSYRIRAYNLKGISDYSNEVEVVTSTSGKSKGKTARFYLGKKSYYVDNKESTLDSAPVVKDGRVMLPIRYIATPIGAKVTWDNKQRKTTVTLGSKKVEIWAGKNQARVNGKYKKIDSTNPKITAITVPPGRVMLPVRFIAENLGCKVEWNKSTREAKVTYPQ